MNRHRRLVRAGTMLGTAFDRGNNHLRSTIPTVDHGLQPNDRG
jgi:hypothetical protein